MVGEYMYNLELGGWGGGLLGSNSIWVSNFEAEELSSMQSLLYDIIVTVGTKRRRRDSITREKNI